MSTAVDFHSQIASIMEVLANAAVAEICKVVDDGYAVVHLEMSRSQKENEFLRRKIKLLELQIARYRAERVKGMEGSISSRFPGVRLLNRHSKDSLAGQLLQGKTRFQNRDPRVQQSVQKRRSGVDCDPDQDVVTTTKTESAEPEDERELLIVKVEGALEPGSSNNKTLVGACISTRGGTDTATSLPATSKNDSNSQPARCHNKTEVSGSDTVTFVVGRTAKTDSSSTTHSSQLTGSSVRAEDSQPLNSVINIMPHRDEVPTCFDDAVDGIKDDEAALNTSKSFLSEVIVIDGGGASDKEGEACEWSHVDKANRETGRGIDRHEQTSLPIIQYLGLESVENRLMQEGSVLPCDDPPGTSGGGIASSVNSSSDAPSLAVHYPVPPPNKSGYKPSSSSCHLAFYHAVTTERPYGCTSCTKRFFLQSDLQKHMARHTREKPYTCLLCSKSFVCQSQLDIHRNVHTGDRPFSCSICNRCFSHPSNLKRHQKIQH